MAGTKETPNHQVDLLGFWQISGRQIGVTRVITESKEDVLINGRYWATRDLGLRWLRLEKRLWLKEVEWLQQTAAAGNLTASQ